MTDASAIEAATKRLAAALDALEGAVERRREADRSEGALAAQVQAPVVACSLELQGGHTCVHRYMLAGKVSRLSVSSRMQCTAIRCSRF